jgi:quinol monooxygenase YgiN
VIIVAGSLSVEPSGRQAYLDGCREVVAAARDAAGCLDYSLSADLLELGRINVFERWESAEALERFRGSGPPDDQLAELLAIDVSEYEVTPRRRN